MVEHLGEALTRERAEWGVLIFLGKDGDFDFIASDCARRGQIDALHRLWIVLGQRESRPTVLGLVLVVEDDTIATRFRE